MYINTIVVMQYKMAKGKVSLVRTFLRNAKCYSVNVQSKFSSQFQYIKSTSTMDPKESALGDSGSCLLMI